MLRTFVRKSALSRVDYWHTLAIIGGIYATGMTINTIVSGNAYYNWGIIPGLLTIAIYLLTFFAKPSTTAFGAVLFFTFVIFLVTGFSFSSGDDIPGQPSINPTREQLCYIVFVAYGVVYPIVLTVLTLLNPYFFNKEKEEEK